VSFWAFGDVLRAKFSHTVQPFLPVVARLRARLWQNSAVPDCASEIVELAPAVNRFQPAAIALPDEFDRVVAAGLDTTIAIELERLKEGQRQRGPTIAYRIDNAVLGDGSLYFSGGYQVIRGRSSAPLLRRHRDNFAEMQLCTGYYIDRTSVIGLLTACF
jgi:hypothetical protein